MNKINLIVNYYKDKNEERQKEVDYCLNKNIQNPLLNVIILQSQERITFNKFFEYLNKISSDSDINIVANSDIFFEREIGLTEYLEDKEAWCLSRWDVQSDLNAPAILFDRKDSQDCIIWRGLMKNCQADFVLGFRGSDNRICRELHNAGYKVSNPSKTVKSFHLHLTGVRNYDSTNKYLVPGPYLFPEPTTLELRK